MKKKQKIKVIDWLLPRQFIEVLYIAKIINNFIRRENMFTSNVEERERKDWEVGQKRKRKRI